VVERRPLQGRVLMWFVDLLLVLRRADEVLAENVEHRAALVATEDRDLAEHQREARQDEVLEAVDRVDPEAALQAGGELARVLEHLRSDLRC
jgi:hypothetical protein